MKNRVKWIVVLVLLILVAYGCGHSNDDYQNTSNEQGDKEVNEEPDIEIVQDTDVLKGPEVLQFVDVYGQPYQMEVNPKVKPNLYQNADFVYNEDGLSYEGQDCTYRLGIDVSRYQGDIDWQKVKNDGIDFVIIRIGYRGYGAEGHIKLDTHYEKNIEGARSAGLDVGVYFFAQAINEEEAVEEAKFVLEHLAGYELQMPIVYDPESILHDDSRTDHVSGEQFTKNTKAFCQTVEGAGYDAMIYCNMLWQAFQLNLEELADYPIWYADYELYPQTPYHFEIWQYSQEGKVDGISGNVDLNIQMIKK